VKRWAAAAVFVLLGAAACGDSGNAADVCQPPPATEIEAPSGLAMTLDPNPVTAGARAVLEVSDAGLAPRTFVGLDATWQCWDGSRWVDTYQLVRAVDPFQAQTIELEAGVTTTVASLGVPVPSIAEILIPDVPPGIYRISDEAGSTPGHLVVEVVEG